MKVVSTPNAPAAIGPYSQAIISNGMVYTSGQIAIDPATGAINGTTIEEQAEQAKLDPSKKTVVVMLDEKKVLEAIREQLGDKYNLVAVFHRCRGYISVADLDQFEWLELIANADMVLSSFFHGVCFSIVEQTPFVAIGTKIKRSKLDDLLLGTELEGHYVYGDALNIADWAKLVEAYEPTDTTHFVHEKRDAFISYLNRLRGKR